MKKYIISDQYQQYQYNISIEDIRELKHIKIETKFQGAKFPDAVQAKVEFFLNADEYQRFKDALNAN
jgi:hypothetical protein